jgi:ATP phosphoribosyltransferase
VETGATLRQAGLVTIGEPILRSSAVLIGRISVAAVERRGAAHPPLQGVLVARSYVMLAYDVRADLLDQATALTPGIESPTVSPLHREGWVAVQAMVLRDDAHMIMDKLYDLGARAILVTDIANCRL